MDNKIKVFKEYLKKKYDPEIAFLYGSFATKTDTTTSDIDCICFAEINCFIHDSSELEGNVLDCWVYPVKQIHDTELMLHIIPCEVLMDKNSIAKNIIDEINLQRKEKIIEITLEEKKQLIGWIKKMINRCTENTIESNYRYNWLVYDFPEIYCKFTKQYYDGPIKTIKIIKEHKEIYNRYEIVCKQKNVQVLKDLYTEIIDKCI